MAVNVVDWFVFTTNSVIALNLVCFICILRSYISKSTLIFCTLYSTVFLVTAVFEVIAVVVNAHFFSDISTLSSDDIPTGLIISATLYSFIGILPVIYFFSFCGQWPETRHKYIVCFTSFIYFTLFVCVLATLHLPGSSTHKTWEDAVNYSYISVGNFIFLASQVAVTTSISSLLTVLYYYAIIAQHNIVVNNQRQDSLLSGSSRERDYGSATLTVNE